jgi:hypothetical protein
METVKERLDRTFLRPQGKISRYLSVAVIYLIGAESLYLYFSINYFLCASDRCGDLVVTKTWVHATEFLLLYGLCCFVLGVFLLRSKQLQILFAWAIDLLAASGFLLFSKAYFAIAIEIGNRVSH